MKTVCQLVTEITLEMPCFSRPLSAGEKAIRLFWRTDSGTGSTLVYVVAETYHEALGIARQYFPVAFPAGYALTGTSIA